MQTLWLISGFLLLTVYIFDRDVLRFDTEAVVRFLKLALIGSSLSVVLNVLLGRIPALPPVATSSLFFVGWEDVLFSLLPIYYANKYLHKNIAVPLIVISSILFGLGHVYQGYFAAALISFYPYFISYKLGKKYGYGTVIFCHVAYDLLVVHASKLSHFILQIL